MTHRSHSRARRDLERLLRNPPSVTGFREPGALWHRTYTRRICRYLLSHLDEGEMIAWEVAFTALHEMVGCAWACRSRDADGLGDIEAWSYVGADEHLALTRVFSQLPASIDALSLVPHMRGFVRFLRAEGAMDALDAERLDREYARFDPTEAPRAVA